ncbi:MAG: NUDIX hydrolase [Candidatus Pacebacteria bacterium]|nr:NUDIX hydrolase [Candidatus Paceibacterota bacterium]
MQKVYNENDFEPEDYTERHTVRCVIFDEDKKSVLLFGSLLVGGGVEEGESDEQAIAREAMEEAGAELEILKPLGEIVAYRDERKKKYVSRGYLCKYIRKVSEPTTTAEDEINIKSDWYDVNNTIDRIQTEIDEILEKGVQHFGKDLFQTKFYNRRVSLDFIKEGLE